MQILDKSFVPFLSHSEILEQIQNMAGRIVKDYVGKDPIFIVLLNGAFMFATDLIRNITLPCQVSFVKVASYHGMSSSGLINEVLGLNENIQGRDVIILDDIVDTGGTMKSMIENLQKQRPSSVEVATLLLKPEAFKNQFPIKYIGFSIPNAFVVGYGLDYNGYGRNLKDIFQYQQG